MVIELGGGTVVFPLLFYMSSLIKESHKEPDKKECYEHG
jgi:hypothetical protein